MDEQHLTFMRMALQEAERAVNEGNSPVGSVIVRDGEVVAAGRNRVYTTHDATAHAETDAIRNAGAATSNYDLSGCTLYTTFEPCPMCCGAILNAGITTIVLGGRPDPAESRWKSYTVDGLIEDLGWSGQVSVVTGVLPEECMSIMENYKQGSAPK